MFGSRSVAAVLLVCGCASPLVAQTAPASVVVSGRMQFQWNSTSIDRDDAGTTAPIPATTFEHRRVRLAVDVQLSDWIRGRVEPDFAMGRLGLRNAWVAFDVDDALVIRAGQFKKPFGLIMLTSSERVPLIERGVRIRGLEAALNHAGDAPLGNVRGEFLVGEHVALLDVQRYQGYDMGLSLEGRRGRLGWWGGVFNGQGSDTRAENDGLSAAARATWTEDIGLPLTLGGAWSRRSLNWPSANGLEARSGDAFAIEAELGAFRRGPWLLAEAVTGDNLATTDRFRSGQVMAAWFVPTGGQRVEGWEPVARVSYGDPDRAIPNDAGILLTPGVNLYFMARNRLMLNWDVYLPQGEAAAQHAARAQINLQF
jgi:hypothetical protein